MKKIYGYICHAEVFLAKISLAVMSFLIFIAAISRTFRYPIVWATDISTFLFAWCVFLSADATMRRGKLVSLDLLTSRLPPQFQKILYLVNQVIIIVFLVALIGYGFQLSYTTRLRTFQGIPGFSYTWVTLSVPVGSILMLITSILKTREKFGISPKDKQDQKNSSFSEVI